MKKNIEMSLKQARIYYKESNDVAFKNMLEENFGKENLISITWESLEEISGYYITNNSTHQTNYSIHDRNIFATENQAKSCLAMAQLSQLMLIYNGDWVPNWNNGNENKYCIQCDAVEGKLNISLYNYIKHFLAFKTNKTAENFMREQNDLIKEYYSY